MQVLSVLSILLILTNALANKTEIKEPEEEVKLKESRFQELDAISATAEESDDKEVKRAKKSTTTTFCVEIRPSGPFQKPFQVCEPAEPAKTPQPTSSQTYSAPASAAYYPAPSYAAQEQPKPEAAYSSAPAYKAPSQPKTGAAYSAPVKTYSVPTTEAPKQYASHGMSYNSYRSKEGGSESGHLMRMTHASEEEEDNHSDSKMMADQQLKSSYGLSNYGGSNSYGGATSYVPVLPKKQTVKHQSHNGLVITCQPNLAGYAHNVPSSLHHPPAVPNYSYRSSTPRGYDDRYGRFQLHSYGNYQPHPQYKSLANGYKATSSAQHMASQHASASHSISSRPLPVQQFGSAYGPAYAPPQAAYTPPQAAYTPPVYKAPPVSIYNAPPRAQAPPSYAPPSTYAQPSAPQAPSPAPAASAYSPQAQPTQQSQAYGQSSQSYAQSPSAPEHAANTAYGGQAQASGYGSPPAAPAPSGYGPTPAAPEPSGYGSAPAAPSGYGSAPAAPSGYGSAPAAPTSSGYGPAPAAPTSSGYGPAPAAPAPSGYGPAPAAPAPGYGAAPAAQAPSGYGAAPAAPAPSEYGSAPAAHAPAPAVLPEYGPAPSSGAASYTQAQSFSSGQSMSAPSAPQPSAYSPPGTYREAEEENRHLASAKDMLQEDKEKHTLKKLEEMSNKKDEHVGTANKDWTSRVTEKTDGMKSGMKNHIAENEIE